MAARRNRSSRRGASSRRSRSSRRGRATRRRGDYAPQPITRPGSRPGLVDVVEVDTQGRILRVLKADVSYVTARKFIQGR